MRANGGVALYILRGAECTVVWVIQQQDRQTSGESHCSRASLRSEAPTSEDHLTSLRGPLPVAQEAVAGHATEIATLRQSVQNQHGKFEELQGDAVTLSERLATASYALKVRDEQLHEPGKAPAEQRRTTADNAVEKQDIERQ